MDAASLNIIRKKMKIRLTMRMTMKPTKNACAARRKATWLKNAPEIPTSKPIWT
jgi:hypothetical protein